MNMITIKICSLVMGNMIGAGTYMMPATIAKYGIYAIIGWFLTSILAVILALLFVKMFFKNPTDGGPYIYAKKWFGDYTGFQMAVGYWFMCSAGTASLLVSMMGALSVLFSTVAANPVYTVLIGGFAVALFTYINLKGIDSALLVQMVVTVFKILPLLIFSVVAVVVLVGINVGQDIGVLNLYTPNAGFKTLCQDVPPLNAILSSASLTVWSFIGLESATVPGGVEKTIINKATIIGVLLTAALYMLSLVGIMLVTPLTVLANSPSPFVDAVSFLFGETASKVMAVSAILCIAGSINGWILIQGEVARSAANHGMFSIQFAKLNKHGAPYLGIILGSVLIFIMIVWKSLLPMSEQFEDMIKLASFTTLIPYAYFSIATAKEFYAEKQRICIISCISMISFVAVIFLIIGEGYETICIGSIAFIMTSLLYKKT